ncbi:hypothetical protein N7495_004686 [Penicillium taxi]|uniref:uncharacterized protein n=1 Tax=Penicillium taxi TaxID=168475 RepID=UPI002544D64A|nr:uncharacterized protein N7495_004686 [Penicillium taxi]KAJ5899942.1 hypothetical protein N7495_004686 [Penicillium taxi]
MSPRKEPTPPNLKSTIKASGARRSMQCSAKELTDIQNKWWSQMMPQTGINRELVEEVKSLNKSRMYQDIRPLRNQENLS